MFNKKTILFTICALWLYILLMYPPDVSSGTSSGVLPRLGVWITVFSPEKVLYSTKSIDDLIKTCVDCGINDIYIQVYRADKAYYDSDLTDRSPYETILSEAGEDTLAYLIKKAKDNGLKVHAWVNLLSVAQNKNANVLKKFGKDAITLDQHGRPSWKKDKKDKLDKYYIRENQIFLEPGNKKIRQYLADITEEIVRKYPGLSGLHLDYTRYPAVVPFMPGARFTSHGISYGYNRLNLENFRHATGVNAAGMDYSRKNSGLWDDWRRKQVTELVRDISDRTRSISPELEISCTTVPSIEKSYLVTFQNWTGWLKKRYADYIIVMNYTDDTELMKLNSESLLLPGLDGRIHTGVGAYLLKDNPQKLESQIKYLLELSPGGITIFSYDEIAGNKRIQKFLADNFKYR